MHLHHTHLHSRGLHRRDTIQNETNFRKFEFQITWIEIQESSEGHLKGSNAGQELSEKAEDKVENKAFNDYQEDGELLIHLAAEEQV